MFTLFEQRTQFKSLAEQAQKILLEFLPLLESARADLRLEAGQPIYTSSDDGETLYIIKEGFVRCDKEGHPLYFLEAGDLVGVIPQQNELFKYVTDSSTALQRVSKTDIRHALLRSETCRELWNQFLETQCQLHALIAASLPLPAFTVAVQRRYVEEGAPIIIQDTSPDEVSLMLYGSADVFVGKTKVGTVLQGEIFGAMAAATKSRRTASVIARSQCIISILPKENFLALIQSHPNTVTKLIENMSRVITSQNEKIVGMVN